MATHEVPRAQSGGNDPYRLALLALAGTPYLDGTMAAAVQPAAPAPTPACRRGGRPNG